MNMQLKYVLLLCSFFVGPSTTLWAPPDASTSAALGAASGVGVATSDPATSHVSVTRPQSTQRTEDSEAGTGLTRQTSGSTALPPAWPGATSPSSFPLRTSTLVASNTAKASHPAPVGQKQQTDLSSHVVAALTYQIKSPGAVPVGHMASVRKSLRSGNTSALRTRASQSTASPSQIPVPPSTPPPSIPPPPPEGHTGIYRQPQPPPPPPLTPQSSASSVVSLDSATSEDEPLATQQKTKQPGFLSRLFSRKAAKAAVAPAAKPPAQKSWWQRWFSSKNAPDAAATTAGNDAAIAERFAQKLQSRASSNATATDAQAAASMPRRSSVGQNGMIARTTTSNSYSATYSNRRFNAHGATQVRVGRDTKGNVVRRTQ